VGRSGQKGRSADKIRFVLSPLVLPEQLVAVEICTWTAYWIHRMSTSLRGQTEEEQRGMNKLNIYFCDSNWQRDRSAEDYGINDDIGDSHIPAEDVKLVTSTFKALDRGGV